MQSLRRGSAAHHSSLLLPLFGHRYLFNPPLGRLGPSPSLWTGSPDVGSAFCVWGCLALVRDTSADKLLACAIPCVFLGFPVDSSNYTFYHPPLHWFLDSRDIRFDESVSYYTQYPCRGLPVPPPPLYLAPSPPPAPASPVPPPPPGPALSGVSHATPLPLVAHQVASPSLQSSSQSPQQPSTRSRQVTVDSGGAGAGGAGAGGATTGGARPGGACLRGAGARGAGTGGASFGGAGAGGVGTSGASFEGAGAGGASSEETGTGGTTTTPPTATTHLQQLDLREQQEEEQEEEEEEQQQQQQQQQQQEQQHQQQQQQQPSQ
ncbi:unnamed protein product [Closterium sp. Yama58-4]|nr:unnamed protein product [Closterium sp. Yama58-4]